MPDRSKRALLVLHLGETSGPSQSLEGAMRWLAERADVDVVVPNAGPVLDRYSEFASVHVLEFEALAFQGGPLALARRAARTRSNVRELRALIRTHPPRLVIQATLLLPAVAAAARLEGVPLLVYAGELLPRSGVRALAGRFLVRMAARQAEGVIACSSPVARQFAGTSASVTTMLPPIDEFYAEGDRERGRAHYGLKPGEGTIVSAGSISEGRGQDTLVEAMAIVRREQSEARCLILGEPHPRSQDARFADRLGQLIASLGVEGAVELAGRTENVAEAFAAADVVVNPARCEEAFGRVAFEAAMAGAPTVSTLVGAVPEYLTNEQTALLIPPDDPVALARAIVRLLDDRTLAARLAAGAAARARRDMTAAGAVEQFRALVESILRRAE